MFPVPETIKQKMLSWLPHVLAGYDYLVIETDNVAPDLEAPALTYYFSSAGTPSYYSYSLIKTVKNKAGGMDDYWGQYHYATMNVVLRATTKTELGRMWEAFIRECMGTRRALLLRRDGLRFVEILNSQSLPSERLPSGRDLFWAQVDLRFEYEVSDLDDADYIQRVDTDLEVGDQSLSYERKV